MYIQIANPIYDVVFKYLMEDNDIAKTIISAIIDEQIESLDFLPQESTTELEQRSLTVYRLDFSAKIITKHGDYKHVVIEIQKAKLPSDILRFRKYLGEQYRDKKNIYYIDDNGKKLKKAMPILSIYFLGHRLEKFHVPVIKILRNCIDLSTGNKLVGKEEFIESLTHDSYIIQIPELSKKIRTDLESLLQIFDQSYITDNSEHILAINEEDYPLKYRKIIRHLHKIVADPEIKKKMDFEDEIIEDLQDLERNIEQKEKVIKEKEKVIKEKDCMLKEKDTVIQEKDTVIQEKDTVIQEKDTVIQEKDTVIQEKDTVIQEKDTVIQEKDTVIQDKESKLKEKDKIIEELKKSLSKLP